MRGMFVGDLLRDLAVLAFIIAARSAHYFPTDKNPELYQVEKLFDQRNMFQLVWDLERRFLEQAHSSHSLIPLKYIAEGNWSLRKALHVNPSWQIGLARSHSVAR
jgi:hypothetical protein